MKEKAVIYARVSSKGQEKEGFSIPAQLDLLKQYAEDEKIEVVAEFVEAETAKCAGRTKFNEMLTFLKKHEDVKIILVEKTDRLYRNFKDYVLLDETNAEIHFVKEHNIISQNSHSHEKLMHEFKVLIAKNYVDNLKEETQKGRKRKIEEGYFIGQVPYGYKKLDPRTTVLDEQKSKFVKRAFELYAEGNISLRALSKKLYNEGYRYIDSNPKISTSQLENMLKNDCYTGLLRYKGKLYQGKHEPIVSGKLFLKAQKAFRKDNKPRTQEDHLFLYTGMLKCAECGKMITCEIKHGKWIYYHCTGNYGKCKNKSIYVREEVIDKQINEAIKNLQIDESIADYLNLKLEESYKELQIMTKEKYDYIKREIEKTNNRLNRLLTIYMDGDIDKAEWVERKSAMEEQKVRLEKQLNNYNKADDKFINEGKNIIELAKNTFRMYARQSIEEKRRMLNYLLTDLVLDKDKVLYNYKKPFSFFAETNAKEDYAEIDADKMYENFELEKIAV